MILKFFPLVFVILVHLPGQFCNIFAKYPDVYKNAPDLILSNGYPVEEHVAQTRDGYLLTIHRIPYGKQSLQNNKKLLPIYLQHGIFGSSADWLLMGKQSLAYILADEGYDVWLGNGRGNTYSKKHISLSPFNLKFWDFSYDEHGQYDLPTITDYILNKTSKEQLIYIGHSQGVTCALALLSESSEYNKKFKLFIAYGPVETVAYISNPIRLIAPFHKEIYGLTKLLRVGEFLPSGTYTELLSTVVCGTTDKSICVDLMSLLYGKDEKQIDQDRLPMFFSHLPAGSSFKSINHYAQTILSKKFTKYDYGSENKVYYNQTMPPEYNVSKITTPTALFWGLNDALVGVKEVQELEEKLNCLIKSRQVPWKEFNHIGFLFAKDARKLLYDETLQLLQLYEK